jgi:hypothetical protein
MTTPNDRDRLAPSDTGPELDRGTTLDISDAEDEAEHVAPVPTKLEPNNDPRLAASKRQDGFIAYFSRPTGGRVRMEQSTPSVADLTFSDAGLKAMNEQWKGPEVFGQWVKPAMRWVHLPANNPDWIKVWIPPPSKCR